MSMPSVVALTGSTSNFGAYILDVLLSTPHITKVYCLNRSDNAKERQRIAHVYRGLASEFPEERVQFVQVDLSAKYWGINADLVEEFLSNVELIIHNAWPVDFNRNFMSFEPHINGVRHLIDIAREREQLSPPKSPMHIIFISSIGTVSNWASQAPTSRAFVPETELTDWKLARTGYGQSKLLSERILAHAARCFNIPMTIARVGQLAGPVMRGKKGAWPEREWLPSLVRSSIYLRAIPQTLGPMNRIEWVPVDVAAQVVGELLSRETPSKVGTGKQRSKHAAARFFHISNPRATEWTALLPTIRKHIPQDTRVVRVEDWVDLLIRSTRVDDEGIDAQRNPAAKLLDTFEHMQDRAIRFPKARAAVMDTKKTVKASTSLAGLPAVSEQWMELWMRQWAFPISS